MNQSVCDLVSQSVNDSIRLSLARTHQIAEVLSSAGII
jgi:hypothetical protein